MIYLKWLALALLDWLLLVTVPVAAILVSAFTREQPYNMRPYTWGGLWGTYDNPPQGDEGFVAKRAWFPGVTTGFKGYLNRVNWMIRNPLYGFAKKSSLEYSEEYDLEVTGKDGISDKDGIPGWYFVKVFHGKELVGFEFYGVFPYTKSLDVRIRLGWKVLTSKFKSQGFAPLVNTFNPVDGYNNG